MTQTLKEFADYLGVTTDTIRHYEKIGLLTPARKANNYRAFGATELEKMKYIEVMKAGAFSLKEIQFFMNLLYGSQSTGDCVQISQNILTQKIIEFEEQIAIYQKMIAMCQAFLPMIATVGETSKMTDLTATVDEMFELIRLKRIGD
ncbi:hypothetical protein Hs30E_07200 [Lactococcus hodotermopsidis]|uniref:HTH merR-type domain-containing protein n=1 Tax=Pseudolactococcus hodotermopsidis TaxID=2709157 RepID=A0A6A0B9P3_9LACT|nr:MerR family transcriptional regulator [Lactococcus hodotermopsidis]GFH42169.1 hypothetical protein Hs30E_07200 [Lactococcus hodotermopsidis]